MSKPNIDDLEKKVDEILQQDSSEKTSEVIDQLSTLLKDDSNVTIKKRAVEALGRIADKNTDSTEHNPDASYLMNEAEKNFYAGKYADAMNLYERVLSIEPSWERAQEHLHQSWKNLETGFIPRYALPAEAGIALGKTQSLFRAGRFHEAHEFIDEAIQAVRAQGILVWQEGEELRELIEKAIVNENSFKKFEVLVNEGAWDQAAFAIKELDIDHLPGSKKEYVQQFYSDFQEFQKFRDRLAFSQEHAPSNDEDPLQPFEGLFRHIHESYPNNPDLNAALESIQEVRLRQQKYGQLLRSAEQAIEATQFELALAALEKARSMYQFPSKELDELTQIAQTGLSLQQKYYELVERGDRFMGNEDYESAMKVYQEADILVNGEPKFILEVEPEPQSKILEKDVEDSK